MGLSLVGTPTTGTPIVGGTTTVTINVPTGVQDGDLLLWDLVGSNATAITGTPTGWTLATAATTTALNRSLFYRYASAEPASYTTAGATLISTRWGSTMIALRGADQTTPFDVAAASTLGTTTTTTSAITPVTTGAWVIGYAGQGFAVGVTPGTFASTNLTVDGQIVTTTASTNSLSGVGHFAWTSGAFTPDMSNSGVTARTIGTRVAIRPGPTLAFVPVAESVTVTATSTLGKSADAPVAETVAVTATSTLGKSGAAPVAAAVAVTATPTLGKSADAPVSEAVAVTATSTLAKVADVPVAETVAVTATSTLGQSANVPVSETVAVTATPVLGKVLSASVAASATVTATPTLGKVGSAPVAESVAVTASGTLGRVGDAPVAEAVNVTASATLGANASASVAQSVAVTATATLGVTASAGVALGVSVTATAEIVVPPRDVHFISVTDRQRAVTMTDRSRAVTLSERPRVVTLTDRSD